MILIGDNRCVFLLAIVWSNLTLDALRMALASIYFVFVTVACLLCTHKGAPLLWQAMWRPLLSWVGEWRIGSFTLWRWDWPLLRRTWSWFVGGMKSGSVGMPVWHQALGWEWHSSTVPHGCLERCGPAYSGSALHWEVTSRHSTATNRSIGGLARNSVGSSGIFGGGPRTIGVQNLVHVWARVCCEFSLCCWLVSKRPFWPHIMVGLRMKTNSFCVCAWLFHGKYRKTDDLLVLWNMNGLFSIQLGISSQLPFSEG